MDMTIKQLAEKLNELIEAGYGEHTACIGYNFGDHWRTQVVPPISDVQMVHVIDSDYHSMPKIVDQDDIEDVIHTTSIEQPELEYNLEDPDTGIEYQNKPLKYVLMLVA